MRRKEIVSHRVYLITEYVPRSRSWRFASAALIPPEKRMLRLPPVPAGIQLSRLS